MTTTTNEMSREMKMIRSTVGDDTGTGWGAIILPVVGNMDWNEDGGSTGV
jgi:hypothetical protein